MTKASETYQLIEPFLKNDFASLFQKTGSGKGQDSEGISILLYDVSKEEIFDYSYSSAGFVAANAASAAGDLIFIPAGTLGITAAFTLKANVTLKGDGVYATFITATITGSDTTLITLASDSTIEDMNITYTSTATNLMVMATNANNNIIRRIHAYHYTTLAGTSFCFHTGTNTAFKCIQDCIFVCDGNGGERNGIFASAVGQLSQIINVYGYAHCTTAAVNAYGISVGVSVSAPMLLQGCYGYGYAQGGTYGIGIYATGDIRIYSSTGKGRSGTSVGIGITCKNNAEAYSCFGYAMNDGGGTSIGLELDGGKMFSCHDYAMSGNRYGVSVWGVSYAVGCRFDGATKDIYLGAGCNFHVYACQYDTTTGTGTITKDAGDLSLGTGTDNRITQWNGAGGLLEDSKLIGPTVGILSLVCAAAGAGATFDLGLAEGTTLKINASIGSKTVDVTANGNVIVGDGGEVNKIPIFNAASHLVDLDNAAGLLQNDGLGNLGSITWSPLLNSSLPDPWALMASSEKTIAAGVLGVDQSYHTVKSETGTTDDLVTINNPTDRQFLVLMAKATHTITIKHDTGNIFLNGLTDFVLTGTKKIMLFYDEVNTKWSDLGAGGGGGGAVATDAIWDAIGDIAAGTGADTAARLPVGTDGQVLTANSGAATGLAWAAAGSGDMANDALWDAKGDLAIGTGNNTGDNLAVGANGKTIVADSGETTGVKWDFNALYIGQNGFLVNEIMNFPSLEKANDTQPEWWSCAGTLTEVDVAGEGITENFERALKFVANDSGQRVVQVYTFADQPRIKAERKLSAIVAVWCVGGAEATISIESDSGTLGTSSASTAAAWTILKVEGVTLPFGDTYAYLVLDITTTGTAYFVPLGVNVGDKALALPPRGLRYQAIDSTLTLDLSGHGDDNTWTDEDVTGDTSNLAAIVKLRFIFRISAAGTEFAFDIRRNGSAKALATYEALGFCRGDSNKEMRITYDAILDDTQIFEYILDRTAGTGTVSICNLFVDGYWEWE